jgi:site-specific recombinase XerD
MDQSKPAPTWPEAVARFQANLVDEEKSAHTLKCYRADLALFAGWFASHYQTEPDLGALGPTVLREWKTHLVDSCKQAPATVNRRLACMRSFVRWAEGEGLVQEFRLPKSVRQVRPPPRWLSRKEQLALLRAAERSKNVRGIAVVALLLHTGLRIAELADLKWADIAISDRKGKLMVRKGKGRKQRAVPVNAEARRALIDLGGAKHGKKDRAVIQGQRGALTVEGIADILEAYGAAAKLEGFGAHVLRHTFCKNLANAGVRLEVIAALAGHESLETTRRYVEPGLEDLDDAVERLAGGADD